MMAPFGLGAVSTAPLSFVRIVLSWKTQSWSMIRTMSGSAPNGVFDESAPGAGHCPTRCESTMTWVS
ncbi:Uncharacterised protein [Burkholderia pseudomallei]|nr:Uncharacterised protein [Burkholderia pseudomallei]VCL04817.1 Uncharacterised protein [Burkholderia pseudomallei]VCL06511.1 Uncharacterised protein [Burkholderia pseudomallei]VCL20973.1 Uncharacterised protein [Burkholderia pseudomallei]